MAKSKPLEERGPAWFGRCIRRIGEIGWRAFLEEEIEHPSAIWVSWDPVEELERWDRMHPQPEPNDPLIDNPDDELSTETDDLGISDDDVIDDEDLPF